MFEMTPMETACVVGTAVGSALGAFVMIVLKLRRGRRSLREYALRVVDTAGQALDDISILCLPEDTPRTPGKHSMVLVPADWNGRLADILDDEGRVIARRRLILYPDRAATIRL